MMNICIYLYMLVDGKVIIHLLILQRDTAFKFL